MRKKILSIVRKSGKSGILQEEITKKYRISKSTVSTVLSKLERDGEVVRKRIAGRSYLIWHVDFSPFPVDGMLRVGILKAIEYPAIFLTREDLDHPQIRIKVYPDAFSLTRDMAEGYIDAGCSPLITQVLFSLVYRSIEINAGCGFNGGGVITGNRKPKIFGSSELSTMEFALRRFMEMMGISGEIRYFYSVEKMQDALKRGMVDGIAIWEPYLTDLSPKYKIIKFEEIFGRYPCCTLGSHRPISERREFTEFLKAYKKAMKQLPERQMEAISLESKALNIPQKLIEKAFNGYSYAWKLDENLALKTLEIYGIKLTDEARARIFNLL